MTLPEILRAVRQVLGVPDYERYLEHARRAHPGCAPMSEDEFFRRRLEERYAQVGTRCC
jgi:uncharacterized short protein YbdD (DUF466 family)